ncbi:hypothetical protein MMC24_006439 [Lignoscripta atroalba]|nr:hypothetical protein [Lignoscripta atroalba]
MDIIREHNIDLDDKRHLIYIRRRLTCKLDLNVTPFSRDLKELFKPCSPDNTNVPYDSVWNPTFHGCPFFATPIKGIICSPVFDLPLLLDPYDYGNTFRFLDLPGEIRNRVYMLCLGSTKTFSIKTRVSSFDTSLLRVNKQICHEASSIFYHENVFRFPESFFAGASILQQLEDVYGVPLRNLRRMKQIRLEIPVYSNAHDEILGLETAQTLQTLWEFIKRYNGAGLKLQANYRIVQHEKKVRIQPLDYNHIFLDFFSLCEQGRGQVECNLETQPFYMRSWLRIMEKFYGKNWSLRVRLCDDYNLIVAPIAASGNALMKSRDSYMLVPSLRELYEEPALQDGFYVFRPRRVVS